METTPPTHAAPQGAPGFRVLAQGTGWSANEFLCRAGPADRPFEERHEVVSISAVVEGSFQYRADAGRALLYPGAFLLGNAGTCFECGHEHGTGDRCIAFQFEPALFEEIAASAAGTSRFRFPVAMLPPLPELAAPTVEIEAAARQGDAERLEALAIAVAERVLGLASGRPRDTGAAAPRDEQRVSRVLRHVEAHAEEPLDLTALAGMACMSRYHFVRAFRRVTGVTPYRYLLGLRLRRAALGLRVTARPVSAIAFEAGFGDLSTFNGSFRAAFGTPPGVFRRGPGRSPAPPSPPRSTEEAPGGAQGGG